MVRFSDFLYGRQYVRMKSESWVSLFENKTMTTPPKVLYLIVSPLCFHLTSQKFTRCGPCKVIAPKFEEFSDKYSDAVFCKVIGDSSPEASKLMKREGVRSVPSFHYFKDGEKVDVVNGANAEAIEASITKNIK